jgi:hypothetical protein
MHCTHEEVALAVIGNVVNDRIDDLSLDWQKGRWFLVTRASLEGKGG